MATQIGQSVVFTDPFGQEHPALVTTVFGDPNDNPSVNLVWVSEAESEIDQYGRQIRRNTSVVHESKQAAHGMKWREG